MKKKNIKQLKPIAILGAGSWGSALAIYLGRRGQLVRMFSTESSEIVALLKDKANNRFLPGFDFPDTIYPTTNLIEAVKDVDDVLMVIPSIGFRQVLTLLKPHINPATRIISATKGLDTATGQLLNEVVEEVLGKEQPFAILSGPSFAREVAEGLPAAVVIASHNQALLDELVDRFDSPIFKVHPSDDVIGVEIGGVSKNVIAIATGISDGMELGTNCRSAIITLGLREIVRLGEKLGGKLTTFLGLSGIGDLILTCTDNQSRNRRLGLALGKSHDIQQAEREIGQVVEGKRNAELITALAKKHQINMPVCATVWEVLQGKLNPKKAIDKIINTA